MAPAAAPPAIALIGLLGMLIGEQLIPRCLALRHPAPAVASLFAAADIRQEKQP
ncbi:DUF1427 family protein [Chromobacterium phragmitis]|uniref:DUF1427 family protein n=1 Tax=Chromobacterium phragmitis TaxID=2202141 RepID=UPI0038783EF9